MQLSPQYPVRTQRLLLRPLSLDDVEALHVYRSREDVCRWVPFTPQTRDELAERITGMWARTEFDDEGQAMTLGVERIDTGELIGDVVLFWHSREHRGGEIGYVINPEFAGNGYATEAANALLGMGFDDLGLHRIIARIVADNADSVRLAQRLGMRQEAHYVQSEFFKGRWIDDFIFAMLAEEWRELSC